MAAQQQTLLNVQNNLANVLKNIESNIIKKISKDLKPEDITPLVYYSIPGNQKLTFKYSQESTDNKTKEYHLKIPISALKLPVTKRIELYSPKIESYWSLIPSAEKLLSDVFFDFKQYGPTYDIDNIGGIVPNTERNALSVLQILYFEDNQAYMTNFFVQNLLFNTDSYEFILHHVSDAKTYAHEPHNSNHPEFNQEYHYHVNSNVDEVIYKEPSSKNFTIEKWSLELYGAGAP